MMSVIPLLFTLLQATTAPTTDADSAARLERAAHRVEAEYESLARRLAPYSLGPAWSSSCDEVVGRFCLRFDPGPKRPIEPVPPRVVRARRDAVQAFRRAFAARPERFEVVGPLVRLLVEDERGAEALAAARTFAWASGDSIWAPLLVGFALHAAGNDSAAEREFERSLAHMPAREVDRATRVQFLLTQSEARAYRRMRSADRAAYQTALWTLADPLYLTPSNESRVEHIARYVWSRLLSKSPVVLGKLSWGEDLEELTVRYGVPVSRERSVGSWITDVRLLERFDSAQLALVPEALHTKGYLAPPLPGEDWPLKDERARSGHVTRTVRRLLPLPHQVTRFPAGDSIVVRFDGGLALDSIAASAGASVVAGVFLLDSSYQQLAQQRALARVRADTARASFEIAIAPGPLVYSLEMIEEGSRLAGRARYRVEATPFEPSAPALSDLLVTQPFGRGREPRGRSDPVLRPRADLVVNAGETLGLYAEASRLSGDANGQTHYRVELTVVPARPSSLVRRAAGWLGRALTLSRGPARPRLSWEAQGEVERAEILAVDVDLSGLAEGLYVLRLALLDLATGKQSTTERYVRIAAMSAGSTLSSSQFSKRPVDSQGAAAVARASA